MSKCKPSFNHGDRETRYRKACERLGSDSPHCILGDESNAHTLQLHHMAGQGFDDETVHLCHNHHARISDGQKDHPPKIDGCTNPLEGVGHILLGLGELVAVTVEDLGEHPLREFLTYLCEKFKEIGTLLIEMARTAPDANPLGAP